MSFLSVTLPIWLFITILLLVFIAGMIVAFFSAASAIKNGTEETFNEHRMKISFRAKELPTTIS